MTQSFDYTARDYESIMAEIQRRVREEIPEWTNYEAGFEMILLGTYAYVGDVLNFYIDRMGNEAYIQSAVMRESVLNIASMFGYIPSPQTAATVTVRFTKSSSLAENVSIPAGTRVYAQQEGAAPIIFETSAAGTIVHPANTVDIVATEGTTVTMEGVGLSTGGELFELPLFYPNVIKDSVRVFTKDGTLDITTGEPSLVEWTPFARLIDASFYDRAFVVAVDETGYTSIRFGDNVSGLIPTLGVEIFATYKYGVGADGNIGVGAIKGLLDASELSSRLIGVTNTTAGSGGADNETMESMRRSIPRSLRTLERAVTVEDWASLALNVPGVAKANSTSSNASSVTLAVAPVGGGAPSTNLTNAVVAYFVKRGLAGATLSVIAPTYVPINVTVSLTVNPAYRQDVVKNQVTAAISNLFAFDNQKFAAAIRHATVFRATVDLLGVDVITITAFNRDGAGDDADFTLASNEIASVGTITVNATGGVVVS